MDGTSLSGGWTRVPRPLPIREAFVAQLTPAQNELLDVRSAVLAWIDNNPSAPDTAIEAAYRLLVELSRYRLVLDQPPRPPATVHVGQHLPS
jgi:hypothetical protein